MADEKKNDKPEKLKFDFGEFDKEALNYFKESGDDAYRYVFTCKAKLTVTQLKSKLNVNVTKDSGNGKITITAEKGTVNLMAKNGDGPLKMDCAPDKLKVQGCVPAYGESDVVSIDAQGVGCIHQPGNLYCKGQAVYNSTAVPPVPTTCPGISLATVAQIGVKLDDGKAKIVKDGDLQVKNTKCGSGDNAQALATVGDKIEIEHKFKASADVVPVQAPSLMAYPMSGAPWPAMMPIQSTDTKGGVKNPDVMANAAGVVPAWTTFLPGCDEFYMLSDAIADSKVVVDSAITDQGASTSVFCEGKKIALTGNNNFCYNDSITRQQCLMIK